MRYERKYRIESGSFFEVRQFVRGAPFSFQSTYPDRCVNSIYLDNPAFDALADNLNGISERIKYRVRWYGADRFNANNPVLEKKIRQNQLGKKERIFLPDFQINETFDINNYLKSNASDLNGLSPKVLVRYLRTYFETQDRKFRLTIDRQIQYYLFNGNLSFLGFPVNDNGVIIELKYNQGLGDKAEEILQSIPFRLTKNSKYVRGIVLNYF